MRILMALQLQARLGVGEWRVDGTQNAQLRSCSTTRMSARVPVSKVFAQLSLHQQTAHAASCFASACRGHESSCRRVHLKKVLHVSQACTSFDLTARLRSVAVCRPRTLFCRATSPSSEGSLNDPVGVDLITGEAHKDSQGNGPVAAEAFGSNGAEQLAGDLKVDQAEADASRCACSRHFTLAEC